MLGIVAILLEIIVFPGFSVAGIVGVLLLVWGIYMAYEEYGNFVGNITLIGSGALAIIATAIAFRYSSWKKVSLHAEIDSKVETLKDSTIAVGDIGITTSRLAPMGSVKVKGRIVEAKALEGYLAEDIEVEIVKIHSNTVIVIRKVEEIN